MIFTVISLSQFVGFNELIFYYYNNIKFIKCLWICRERYLRLKVYLKFMSWTTLIFFDNFTLYWVFRYFYVGFFYSSLGEWSSSVCGLRIFCLLLTIYNYVGKLLKSLKIISSFQYLILFSFMNSYSNIARYRKSNLIDEVPGLIPIEKFCK